MGQWTKGGQGQAASGKPGSKTVPKGKAGKGPKGVPIPKSAHAAHVRQQRHQLLSQAASDRQKAHALIQKRNTLQQELASASGQTNKGQSGSTTSGQTGATTASSAPATATNPAGTSSTLTQSPGSTASLNTTTSQNQLKTQIAALNTQISNYLTQAAQDIAKAKALK